MEVEDAQLNAAHRVVLKKLDDSGDQQLVDYEGLEGEEHTKVLRIMPHGLISNPDEKAEGIITGLGTRDMPVFFGGEHPDKRPKGLPKNAAGFYDGSGLLVYGDGQGNIIVRKAKSIDAEVEGEAKLKAKTLTLEATTIKLKGNVEHTGNMTTSGTHTDSIGTHKP